MSPFCLSTADKNLATFVISKKVNMNLTLLWYVALYRNPTKEIDFPPQFWAVFDDFSSKVKPKFG